MRKKATAAFWRLFQAVSQAQPWFKHKDWPLALAMSLIYVVVGGVFYPHLWAKVVLGYGIFFTLFVALGLIREKKGWGRL